MKQFRKINVSSWSKWKQQFCIILTKSIVLKFERVSLKLLTFFFFFFNILSAKKEYGPETERKFYKRQSKKKKKREWHSGHRDLPVTKPRSHKSLAGPAVGQSALELGDPLYNEGWGHGLFVSLSDAPDSEAFHQGGQADSPSRGSVIIIGGW